MGLWVSSDTDTKVVAVCLADVLDEIRSETESTCAGNPFFLAMSRIASEGKDILVAAGACFLRSINQ